MGAIFEAEHVATERRVALKLLFPHIMSVASARRKFELEAKISARVNSPFIVEVLDAGYDDVTRSPFLVMELLDGQTLSERVRDEGPLPVDEALRLLEQIGAGLDAAHGYREPGGVAKPIVHRDLKPENLFLARQHDGSVIAKILDYGIAKVLGDTTNLSQEVRGTPLFMSFEQITAGAVSPQTDVWALGLIAWHMLTGARYWRSPERPDSTVQSLFAEILTLPLEAPSVRLREQNVSLELPAAFDAWLLRCINRDPSQRFPTAGGAVEELGRLFERAPRTASRPLPQPISNVTGRTQTFVAAAAPATPAALGAPPATPSGVGSVPAMATTGHRRSLPIPARITPVHWAAGGALGGALLLGAILWLSAGGDPPDATSPSPAPTSASAPRAAASPAAATAPATSPPAAAVAEPPPAAPPPAAARASGDAPSDWAVSEPAAARGAAATPAERAVAVPPAPSIRIAPIDEASPSEGRSDSEPATENPPPQPDEPAASAPPPASDGSEAPSAAVAGEPNTKPGATPRKRPRKPRLGTGEAYDTR